MTNQKKYVAYVSTYTMGDNHGITCLLYTSEFVKCLMELKYLAEVSTLDLEGDRRRMGARILSALCLAEAMQSE